MVVQAQATQAPVVARTGWQCRQRWQARQRYTASAGPRSSADFSGPVLSGDGLVGTTSGARSRSPAPTMSAGASRLAAGSHPDPDRSVRPGRARRAERSPGQPGLRGRVPVADSGGLDSGGTATNLDTGTQQKRRPGRPGRLPGPEPAAPGAGSDARISSSELASSGLPIRVRQASLAPQLRDSKPAPARAGQPGLRHRSVRRARRAAGRRRWQRTARTISHWRRPGVARGGAEHHERTERGWQLGRSEAAEDAEPQAAAFLPGGRLPVSRSAPPTQTPDRPTRTRPTALMTSAAVNSNNYHGKGGRHEPHRGAGLAAR